MVTVIVPTHLDENANYLKECVKSLLASTYEKFEILVIADTERMPALPLDEKLKIWWDKELNTATKKLNFGSKHCLPETQYLWLISDDVVVHPEAMKRLVLGLGNNELISNPMSNSDNGSQFFSSLSLPVKMSLDEYIDLGKERLLNQIEERLCPKETLLVPVPVFVAFYCTMIPKKVWDKVGLLDERMDVRHNDLDYCLRAAKLEIRSVINYSAFALHFGDKTLPKCTSPEEYQKADEAFYEKYGKR